MARKSKRLAMYETKSPENKNIYNVAVYLRLSIDEKRDIKDSESLTNQKNIILDFIKDKPYMKVYDIYSDNGETGTNFERGEFQRMMYDIYNNKVNCIIVKDLSRFGREYIEAGDYLDRIFPLLGIRFIAINDNVDNYVSPLDVSVPIKNIVNAMYAKDISKKSSAALRIKQVKGDFIGGQAPYGYLMNPEDNHKIIIDPETAPIVKLIFEWKADGWSYQAICRKLHELNIMPPARYKYDRGIIKDKRFANSELWNTATIKSILTSETYIGNITQGKTKSCFLDGAGRKKLSKADWVIVEGTHKPIVSKELFYKAQNEVEKVCKNYIENTGKYHKIRNNNFFKGKIVCGECGSRLVRSAVVDTKLEKAIYTYNCRKRRSFPDLCSLMPISEQILKNIVIQAIQTQIIQLCDFNKVVDIILKKDTVRIRRMEYARSMSDIISKIGDLKQKRISLTKEYARGVLNDEEYEKSKSEMDKQFYEERSNLGRIENARYNFDKILSTERWIDELKKHKDANYLTQEIVDAFVKQITVYKDKRIEIQWTYQEQSAEIISQLKGGTGIA